MMRCRTLPAALALLAGVAACDGGDEPPVDEDQSIVVIQLNFEGNVPELRQIKVAAHLGSAGLDAELFFPTTPTPTPIPAGATLALLIPPSRSGLLDLIVYGLDANQTAVARGNGQTTIAVGARVDTTISLAPCAAAGCN
jgi:hypothetical protein